MKQWLKNNKWFGVLAAVILFIGVLPMTGLLLWKNLHTDTPAVSIEHEKFNHYKIEKTSLGNNSDDVGVMILNCDDESDFKSLNNGRITHREGLYVQGTGGLRISSILRVSEGYFKNTDISDYEKGSVHVSFYVSDTDKLGNGVFLELTSSGQCDKEELQWSIPSSVLDSGWNDLYLGISDARLTGEPNLKKINYYRLYTMGGSKVGVEVGMDNIYATTTEGMSLDPIPGKGKTATTKKGMLLDFDTLDGLSSSGTLIRTNAKGEYKEGKGAVVVFNPKSAWIEANLKSANLVPYEKGTISFWMYVNDAAYVNKGKYIMELGSAGTYDKNEISFICDGASLKTGWNEIELPIASAIKSSEEAIDMTNVNYLRIYPRDCDNKLFIILDAIQINPLKRVTPENGMLLNCDSTDRMNFKSENNFSITTKSGEFKEGTGAFNATGSKNVFFEAQFLDVYDISKYADGGLHVWLYVSDTKKIDKPVSIEISSAGKCDVNEYQWQVKGLDDGWNELFLEFKNAIVTKGEPDMTSINYLRVFTHCTGEVTMMLDDVYAVMPETNEMNEPGVISTCDSARSLNLVAGSLTKKTEEIKEGTGAFINKTNEQTRIEFKLNNPVDVTPYVENGALHFWFYIDDPAKLMSNLLLVDLGQDIQNFIRWNISADSLVSGWNELVLPFEDKELYFVDNKLSDTPPDLTKIDWFRIPQATGDKNFKEMITIVDDIRVVTLPKEEIPENVIALAKDYEFDMVDSVVSKASVDDNGTTKTFNYKEVATILKNGNEYRLDQRNYDFLENVYSNTDLKELALEIWLKSSEDRTITWGNRNFLTIGTGDFNTNNSNEKQTLVFKSGTTTLKAGEWTKVILPLKDAVNKGDLTTLKDFTWMRLLFRDLGKDAKIAISDMMVVKVDVQPTPPTPTQPVVTDVLLSCDSMEDATVCSGVSLTTATGEFKEGTGAFKSTRTDGMLLSAILKQPVNIQAYQTGGIHLWIYIGNNAQLGTNISVEIGSDETADVHEYQWNVPVNSLNSGWTELYLPFENVKNGNADLTAIKRIRIYSENASQIDAIIDDVRATLPEMPGVTLITAWDVNMDSLAVTGTATVTDGGKTYSINYKETPTGGTDARIDFNTQSTPQAVQSVALTKSSLSNYKLEFWMKSNSNVTINLNDKIFKLMGGTTTEDFTTYALQLKGTTISLTKDEWTKVSLPLDSTANENSLKDDFTGFKWVRFLMTNMGADTKIAISDMKLVEIEKKEIFKTTILTAREMDSNVQQATVTDGTINYVNKAATKNGEKYRVDISYPITVEDLTALKLEDLALEFWMKSSVNKEIKIDESANHFKMGTGVFGDNWGNANQHLNFKGQTIKLTAGEWTKVTIPLKDAINAGNLTTSAEFTWLRFLMMDMGEGTVISLSDFKLVEIEKKEIFKTTILTAREMDSNVQQAEVTDGTINYVNKTAAKNGEKYRVDISYPITVEDLTALKLEDLALEFWMKSSVNKEIKIDESANHFKMGTGVFGDNWGNANQHLNFKGQTISLTAGEWTKVTIPLKDAINAGNLTTSAEFTWLRFLMMDMGEGTVISLSDLKLVEIGR